MKYCKKPCSLNLLFIIINDFIHSNSLTFIISGCKVVIASRKEDNLKSAAKEIDPSNEYIATKVCNIREENQVK